MYHVCSAKETHKLKDVKMKENAGFSKSEPDGGHATTGSSFPKPEFR
jgi:hypothetical protein